MDDSREDMKRRDFLKTGLGVAAGTAAIGSGLVRVTSAEVVENDNATNTGNSNMPRIPYKKFEDVKDEELAESWRVVELPPELQCF